MKKIRLLNIHGMSHGTGANKERSAMDNAFKLIVKNLQDIKELLI